MTSETIRKNLLDLEYNKNLQYFNTCIILIFTYLIGLTIAIFTQQINATYSTLITVFSMLFLSSLLAFLVKLNLNMKNIKIDIGTLNL